MVGSCLLGHSILCLSMALVINILSAIFYFIKIIFAVFNLMHQFRSHNDINGYQNLENTV